MVRSIRALCVEMVGKPYRAIIVRPETRMSATGPVNANRSWLNVRAGDKVVLSGKAEQIRSVTLYDVLPVSECDKEVTCGADWLAQDGESAARGGYHGRRLSRR
jgi:hypothetical protein